MAIQRLKLAVTGAAGGAGVATASATTSRIVTGVIRAVHLAYTDTPPATTDVTIAEASQSPAMSVLTVSNAAADGWFFPMAQADNQVGADISGMGTPIAVSDYLTVTIAQANDADGVVATIVWDDLR
jgi:hypothetical protein